MVTVCDEGYYRENGTCNPCAINTFKNVTGDDGRRCTACPYNTTSGPGSASCGEVTFTFKGPFTPSVSVNTAITLATQLSLTTMELLENGVTTHFGVTPMWSMRTVSQASSQC